MQSTMLASTSDGVKLKPDPARSCTTYILARSGSFVTNFYNFCCFREGSHASKRTKIDFSCMGPALDPNKRAFSTPHTSSLFPKALIHRERVEKTEGQSDERGRGRDRQLSWSNLANDSRNWQQNVSAHPGWTFLDPVPRLCRRAAISSVVSRCSWCGCAVTVRAAALDDAGGPASAARDVDGCGGGGGLRAGLGVGAGWSKTVLITSSRSSVISNDSPSLLMMSVCVSAVAVTTSSSSSTSLLYNSQSDHPRRIHVTAI